MGNRIEQTMQSESYKKYYKHEREITRMHNDGEIESDVFCSLLKRNLALFIAKRKLAMKELYCLNTDKRLNPSDMGDPVHCHVMD